MKQEHKCICCGKLILTNKENKFCFRCFLTNENKEVE